MGSSGGQIGGVVFYDEEDAILWRRDGRCGPEHLLPDGRPGQCDPNAQTTPKGPCCSSHGFCGHTTAHCNCPGCTDYRIAGGRKVDDDGVNFERSTPTPPKRPEVRPPTSQTEEEFSQKEEEASSTILETIETKSTATTPSTSPPNTFRRPTSSTNEYLACPTVLTIKTNVYKGTQNPEKCQFPFKFLGKVYNTCTTDEDPNEKHWCAVEVDENGNSEGKRWGYCEGLHHHLPRSVEVQHVHRNQTVRADSPT